MMAIGARMKRNKNFTNPPYERKRLVEQSVSKDKSKIITANAIRQARYAEKMRTRGMRKLTVWVKKEEEEHLRAVLNNLRNGQGRNGCRT